MQLRPRTLAASITAGSVLALPAAEAAPRQAGELASTKKAKRRLPPDYGAWSRVAKCESGGWRVLGWAYPDPLGITRANWIAAGGTPLLPGWIPLPERPEVIGVADRFRARYGIAIPDQNGGCASW